MCRLRWWGVACGAMLVALAGFSVSAARADSAFSAAPLDLRVDFGTAGSPVEAGFTQAIGPSGVVNVGGVTVTFNSTSSPIDRGAGGDMLRDFIWGNPTDVTVSITGLNPERQYDLTLYSIDVTSNQGHTQTFLVNGNDIGSLVEPGGNTVPLDPALYSVNAIVTPTALGVLDIVADTPGVLGGPTFSHLNGLTLFELVPPPLAPEPASALVMGLALASLAGFYWVRRRRGAV